MWGGGGDNESTIKEHILAHLKLYRNIATHIALNY